MYETFTPEVACLDLSRYLDLKFLRIFDEAFDLCNSTNSVAKGVKSAFTVEY